MNVKTFDEDRLKQLLKVCDPYLYKYIEALKDNSRRWEEISQKAIQKLKEVSSECVWKQEDWEYGPIWNAECGASWVFIEGGPEDNNIKYCHSCGKLIRLSKTEEVSSE